MRQRDITLALIHEVFTDSTARARLTNRLAVAREAGAELAVLPELPLDPWPAGTRIPRDEDAEAPGGRRHELFSDAAAASGVAVFGGAIVRDPDSGRRFNRALLFDAGGELVASYDKLHLPSEEGFWESDHYEPGETPPSRIDALGFPLGLQICSDLQRPWGCQLLARLGAGAILAPRATPPASFPRWKTVITANAITTGSYVVSVNRPVPDGGVEIGGPSIAVSPTGELLAESTDPLTTVVLENDAVSAARKDYPGYLDVRAELYARAWTDFVEKSREPR